MSNEMREYWVELDYAQVLREQSNRASTESDWDRVARIDKHLINSDRWDGLRELDWALKSIGMKPHKSKDCQHSWKATQLVFTTAYDCVLCGAKKENV